MRMWKLPATLMCDMHLLGEHGSLHLIAGSIQSGRFESIQGACKAFKVEVSKIIQRHAEIEDEMLRRDMEANSPLGITQDQLWEEGKILASESIVMLCCRCPNCREKIQRLHPGLLEKAVGQLPPTARDRVIRDNIARMQDGREHEGAWALFIGFPSVDAAMATLTTTSEGGS